MRKTRTTLIAAIAVGLLAGSAVGVAGQEPDMGIVPPVEVTGRQVDEDCRAGRAHLFRPPAIDDVHVFRPKSFRLHCDVDGGHAAADDYDVATDRQGSFVFGLAQIGNVVDRA